MKAKLCFEDKEVAIDIEESELIKLITSRKLTGYERVKDKYYYYSTPSGRLGWAIDKYTTFDDEKYESANYYSNKTVAENNARADKLMRQLRRFAIEYRKQEIDWHDHNMHKYIISFNYKTQDFYIDYCYTERYFGLLIFDSQESAQLAIDTFHDELIWYFTEYKNSL